MRDFGIAVRPHDHLHAVVKVADMVINRAALKTLLCVVLGLPLDPHRSFTGIGNCHWVELIETYEGDRFRLGAYNLSTPDFASTPPVS